MATVQRYVNRAATAGGNGTTNLTSGATRAYRSLSEWEANEQTAYASTDSHIVDCCGTSADTTSTNISGWATPNSGQSITVRGNRSDAAGFYSGPLTISTSHYRLVTGAGVESLLIGVPRVTVDGIQVETTGGDFRGGIRFNIPDWAIVRNCRVRASSSTDYGIGSDSELGNAGTVTMTIENNIVTGFDLHGIVCRTATFFSHTWNVYHNTVYGDGSATAGIRFVGSGSNSGATFNCKGNAIGNCGGTADIAATLSGATANYNDNAVQDSVGRSGDIAIGTLTNAWTSPGTGQTADFTVKNTSSALYNAVNPTLVTTDIIGFTRDGTNHDVGAFEYQVTATPVSGTAGGTLKKITSLASGTHTPLAGTASSVLKKITQLATGSYEGPPPPFLTDTFTHPGISTVLLTAHTGETGCTWAAMTGGLSNSTMNIDQVTGRCYNNGTFAARYIASVDEPLTNEYDIEGVLYAVTKAGYFGIGGRGVDPASDAGGSYYMALFRADTDVVELRQRDSGTETVIDTYTIPGGVVAGTTYTLKLEIRNSAKKVYLDGLEVCSASDNSHTTAGKVVLQANNGTRNTGIHITSLNAYDLEVPDSASVLPSIVQSASVKEVMAATSAQNLPSIEQSATLDNSSISPTFVEDTFTHPGVSTVLLTAHTGESGVTWAAMSGGLNNSVMAIDQVTGRCYVNGNFQSRYIGSNSVPVNNEYDVTGEIYAVTKAGFFGIGGRAVDPADDTGGSYYLALLRADTDVVELRQRDSGTETVLDTYSIPGGVVAGNTYTLRLRIRDAYKRVWLNGVQVCNSTANSHTTTGKVMLSGNLSSQTTGLHITRIIGGHFMASEVSASILPSIIQSAAATSLLNDAEGTASNILSSITQSATGDIENFFFATAASVLPSILVSAWLSHYTPQTRPFADESHWNRVLGSEGTRSQAGVAADYIVQLSTWDGVNEWSVPVYHATMSDPLQPVLFNIDAWNEVAGGNWARSGNDPTTEAEILSSSSNTFLTTGNVFSSQEVSDDGELWVIPSDRNVLVNPPVPPAEFYIPNGAVPAAGWDGGMAIYQPDGKVLDIYGGIRLSTGELVAMYYSVIDPTAMGDGWWNGMRASMLPGFAGLIMKSEAIAGEINHAMALQVSAGLLTEDYAYPALAFDRDARTEDVPYSGTVPMGGRLALPVNFNIATAGFQTTNGLMLAQAAKDHGFFIVDRGGDGISVLVEDSDVASPIDEWVWEEDQDLHLIFDNLELVSNVPLPPSFSATSAGSLPSITQSAVGASLLAIPGTAASVLASIVQSSIVKQEFHASAQSVLGSIEQSSSAIESFEGTGESTLQAITQSASLSEAFIATSQIVLPEISQSASSIIGSALGTANSVLPSLVQSAEIYEAFFGTAESVIPAISQSAAAQFGSSEGLGASALSAITQSASLVEQFIATAQSVLSPITQSASLIEALLGTGDSALPAITQSASLIEAMAGTAENVLPSLTQSVSIFETIFATAAGTLPSIIQSGVSVFGSAQGTGSSLLPNVTQFAEIIESILGESAGVLPAIVSGAEGITGSATGTAASILASVNQEASLSEIILSDSESILPSISQEAFVEIIIEALGGSVLPSIIQSGVSVFGSAAGTAESVLSPIDQETSGEEIFIGTASSTLPKFAQMGEVIERFIASSEIILPSVATSGAASLEQPTATGASELPAINSDGFLEEIFAGSGAIFLPGLIQSASADLEIRFDGVSFLPSIFQRAYAIQPISIDRSINLIGDIQDFGLTGKRLNRINLIGKG